MSAYRRCRTNAPTAYDYDYVVQVSGPLTADELRLFGRMVSIPIERYEYQTARYQSGMYFVVPA